MMDVRIKPILWRRETASDRLCAVCTALAGEWKWQLTDAEVARAGETRTGIWLLRGPCLRVGEGWQTGPVVGGVNQNVFIH